MVYFAVKNPNEYMKKSKGKGKDKNIKGG